jgi:hypothetical protein
LVSKTISDIEDRQVLVHLGNRYVLFGSETKLPASFAFSPKDIQSAPARVPYEDEVPTERLLNSIRLSGTQIRHVHTGGSGDISFEDKNGKTVLVEVKFRERDLGRADYERFGKLFRDSRPGTSQEVWNFNVERLHLEILEYEEGRFNGARSFRPLDVWEFDTDGSIFHRAQVLERVNDWEHRITALFDQVDQWATHANFQTDRTRKVLMSEELMQKFAVPDRELPVLDILRGGDPVASFVPAGLWLIGANGRIDVIMHEGSRALIDNAKELKPSDWNILGASRREFQRFDEAAFRELMSTP